MSLVKNNMKLVILLIMAMVIGGGTYYFTTILPPQLENLQILREQNEVKKRELQSLESKLSQLPEIQQKLKDMGMETQALKNKIPHHKMSFTMMMEIIKYMEVYDFQDTQVIMGEPIMQGDETSIYNTIPMTIKYTTTYDNAAKFLEEISRSYQMVTVDSFSIDNSIQEQKDQEGNEIVAGDVVEAEIRLSLHYLDSEEKEEYPNFMEFSNGQDKVFLRPGRDETKEVKQTNTQANNGSSRETSKDRTQFEINLADIFRSGHNYSFSGYSPGKDSVYVGLTSETDTTLILTVKDGGYSCLIQDANGKQSEKKVDVSVINPSVNINSQIQKVMENMPTVKIQIRNYTANVMKVNISGSLIDNILIYNEDNKIVPPGTQVGKIALIT